MATYKVQGGDTLSAIAKRFGVSVSSIVKANQIDNPNLIRAGATLNIPGKSAANRIETSDVWDVINTPGATMGYNAPSPVIPASANAVTPPVPTIRNPAQSTLGGPSAGKAAWLQTTYTGGGSQQSYGQSSTKNTQRAPTQATSAGGLPTSAQYRAATQRPSATSAGGLPTSSQYRRAVGNAPYVPSSQAVPTSNSLWRQSVAGMPFDAIRASGGYTLVSGTPQPLNLPTTGGLPAGTAVYGLNKPAPAQTQVTATSAGGLPTWTQYMMARASGYGQSAPGSIAPTGTAAPVFGQYTNYGQSTPSNQSLATSLRAQGLGGYAPTGQTLGAQQTGSYAAPQRQYTTGTTTSPLWGRDYGSSIASGSSIAKLLGATVVEDDNDPINLTASVSRGRDAAGNIILNDNDLREAARLTQGAIMRGQVPNKMSVDVAMRLMWPRTESDYSFQIYGRTFDSAQEWLDFMNYQYDPSTGWYVYTEPNQNPGGYGGGGYGGSGGYSRYSGGVSGGRTSSGGSGYGGNYGLVNWRI